MKLIDRTALRLHPAAKGFVNVNACLLASKMPSDAYDFLTFATPTVQSPMIHRTHMVGQDPIEPKHPRKRNTAAAD